MAHTGGRRLTGLTEEDITEMVTGMEGRAREAGIDLALIYAREKTGMLKPQTPAEWREWEQAVAEYPAAIYAWKKMGTLNPQTPAEWRGWEQALAEYSTGRENAGTRP